MTGADRARRVLVTGAGGGIGRAIAFALAGDGFDVTVHYRSSTKAAAETAQQIIENGGRARTLGFDVSDRQAARGALEADVAEHGAYWGIVCNAGVTADHAFPAMPASDWDRVVDTNLNGFFNVVHPLVMPLVRLRRGGRIVTLASAAGVIGNRGQVNYSAAKAGLVGATKALATELASRRITVNCVAPGLIDTAMLKDLPLDEMLRQVPAGRVGTPHEVAATVAFLFSEPAAYITRQVICVNGGMF